jgi:hypothetical protein
MNTLQKHINVILSGLVLLSFCVSAQASGQILPALGGQRAGTSSMTFLKIGVGARATGMGGAFVGMANNVDALFWNPAGTGWIKRPAFAFHYLSYPANIQYAAVGAAIPLHRWGTVGLILGNLATDEMEERTEYHPEGTGNTFIFSDVFAGISYSYLFIDRFAAGVGFKVVREDLAGVHLWGGMLDLGTCYYTSYRDLTFAVTLVNFGPNLRPGGHAEVIDSYGNETEPRYQSFSPPTIFRMGGAMSLYQNHGLKSLLGVQLNHPVDTEESISLGSETSYLERLFLRAGYQVNHDTETWSAGAGISFPFGGHRFEIDVAYSDLGLLSQAYRSSLAITL